MAIPFLARAAKFKDVSVSLELVAAIHRRKATIGEVVAHQLRHSRRDHIHQALSVEPDQDFDTEFQKRIEADASTCFLVSFSEASIGSMTSDISIAMSLQPWIASGFLR